MFNVWIPTFRASSSTDFLSWLILSITVNIVLLVFSGTPKTMILISRSDWLLRSVFALKFSVIFWGSFSYREFLSVKLISPMFLSISLLNSIIAFCKSSLIPQRSVENYFAHFLFHCFGDLCRSIYRPRKKHHLSCPMPRNSSATNRYYVNYDQFAIVWQFRFTRNWSLYQFSISIDGHWDLLSPNI